jgi:transmembrane sensor
MTQDKRTKFNVQISEEAAAWFVDFRLGDIDASARREFDAWIRSSQEHLRAYLETAAIWNEGSSLSAHRDLDSEALIALAQRQGNVIPLDVDPPRNTREAEEPAELAGQAPAGRSHLLERSVSPQDADNVGGDRLAPITLESGKVVKPPNQAPPGRSVSPQDAHEADGDRPSSMAHESNFPASAGERRGRDPRSGRSRLIAVAASILLVTAALTAYLRAPRGVYETAVGERRILTLEDGSSVELNSRSRIRVRFAQDQRDVELLEGQALFHVAKDRHRPFIVHSDTVRVRAVGTQFDVNRKTTGTTVTVVEGRVAVYRDDASEPGAAVALPEINTKELPQLSPHAGPPRTPTVLPGSPAPGTASTIDHDSSEQRSGSAAVFLSAGDQVTVSDQAPSPQPQHASPAAATAWVQGQLVLDAATLTDVAEEFNRYSSRRLIVEDHEEHPLRLSGVFATDPDFLLRYLRQRPDITLQETPTEVRIIRHD